MKPDKGWRRRFDDPIPVAKGKELVALRDAALYITKLPKAEHDAEEWQAAMEALLLVAEHGGPVMLARIGVMRALNRERRTGLQSRSQRHTSGKTQAEARPVMDIYDGADWTEMDIDDLKAAIEGGVLS